MHAEDTRKVILLYIYNIYYNIYNNTLAYNRYAAHAYDLILYIN